jgi:hypothetical protein
LCEGKAKEYTCRVLAGLPLGRSLPLILDA